MTTILIAGANRGLGLEFVRQYAKEGITIHATARRPEQATALIALANDFKGLITLHPLDVASDASVAHLKREVGATPLDVLICNAGVYGGEHQNHGDVDFSTWLDVMNINALGPVRLIEAFADNLSLGTQKKAIAITSMMGSTTDNGGGYLAYRSSKAALNNAMRSLHLAMKQKDIVVAPVHPGWVKTDMGGPNAPLTPEQSVQGMRSLIAKLSHRESGRFWDFSGKELPW